jgi:heat shock protein HslJ
MKTLLLLLSLFAGLFSFAQPQDGQDITGVHWKLAELNGHAVKGDFDQDLFLEFKPEYSFVGFAGCNKINGHYEFGNGRIHFMRIVGTMKGCAQLELEQAFKIVLEDARTYRRDGNALTFMNGGKVIARFTAAKP